MSVRVISLSLAACLSSPVLAQVTVLDAITVTDEAGAPVAGTDTAARLQTEYQGAGLAPLLNGIAGVTTQGQAGDPAMAVNIRGLQGDGRVVVTVDGARQNFARAGHTANGTFTADPEMLRSVAVLRGPAGAAAGAGAIGGTMALRTVTAADLIPEGEDQGGEGRLRFGTLQSEPTVHLGWGGHVTDNTDAMIAVTSSAAADYRAGDGSTVHAANETLSSLAKLEFALPKDRKLTLSISQIASDFITGYEAGTLRQNDSVSTNAVADLSFGDAGTDWQGSATLYRSVTSVDQQGVDADLQPLGAERSYGTRTTGLRAEAATDLTLGGLDHALTLGLDGFTDRVATDDPTATGGSLTPSGRRGVWSLLAEDQIDLAPDMQAVLGLRHDSYRLSSDDGNSQGAQTSPSITLRHSFGEAVTVHASLARGYRPPSLSEALVNGQHPAPATFDIRPNPDLQPESALTQEIGIEVEASDVLHAGDQAGLTLTAYRNDVRDYIGLVQKGGLFDRYYQYDNLDHVRIDGLEAEARYDSDRFYARLSGQISHSQDLTNGGAVSGVAPARAVLTLGLHSADGRGDYGARITSVAARADGTLSSDAWTTADLFVNRQLTANIDLGLALNNITDASYTQYLNTQPSPGFNATAALTIRF